MAYGIIYKISNIINGKVYIGQTTKTLEERKSEHIRKINVRGQAIYSAFRKYGLHNFKWEIIDKAINQDELNHKEIYWIAHYNSYGKDGYNMSIGGEGFGSGEYSVNFGRKLSKEHREKISRSLSGENHHFYGKKLSKEHRDKLRKSKEGFVFTKEHRNKISEACRGKLNGFYGKKHTEESRRRMSKAKRGGKAKQARPVAKLTIDGGLVEFFDCAKDGAKSVNGDRSAVIKCCKGKQKHHKGFVWKYKEDYTSLEGVPECRT